LSFRSDFCHSPAIFVIPQRFLSFRSAAEESAFALWLVILQPAYHSLDPLVIPQRFLSFRSAAEESAFALWPVIPEGNLRLSLNPPADK
jgi:hypothetical protein